MVMLGRVYIVWRIFTFYSSWNGEKADEICTQCLTDGGVGFALKAELKDRPYTLLGVSIIISIFVFGLAMRTAE
jgi:hypothetical protein